MVVMVVVVVVAVLVATCVGAGFGVEGGVDDVYVAAELFDHGFNDVVSADADLVPYELDREVAVAEVPGDADEFGIGVGVDFGEGFRTGADFYDGAGIELQAVAVAQAGGLGEIEEEILAGFGFQDDAAAVAAIEIDQDFVGGPRGIPGAGGEDGLAAERHGRSLGDFAARESVLKTEQNGRGEARWG
jgi:hypothetical protein